MGLVIWIQASKIKILLKYFLKVVHPIAKSDGDISKNARCLPGQTR